MLTDPTFGLNAQALAVLHFLADEEPDFAPYDKDKGGYQCRTQTFPMYNGRERGFCLVVEKALHGSPEGPTLHIFIAENRSSDAIFVQHWFGPAPWPNEPQRPDGQAGTDSYEARRHYDFGRLDLVREDIMKCCREFFLDKEKPGSLTEAIHREGLPKGFSGDR